MQKGVVTVFGGSGFVGKYVVRALVKSGWRVRIAMRRPYTGQALKVIGRVGQIQLVQADLHSPSSVMRAIEGVDAVVNLAAVLFEKGRQSFYNLHVCGPEMISQMCVEHHVRQFVHLSALGVSADSPSRYGRSKAEGEARVRAHMPGACFVRPSLIFGAEDNFFNRFAAMAQTIPVLPLINQGKTRFQPVYVENVAQAVATILERQLQARDFDLAGPQIYSYKDLMQIMLEIIDRKCWLVSLPGPLATGLAMLGDLLACLPYVEPFLTSDQLCELGRDNILMQETDNGLNELDITPAPLAAVLPGYLYPYRRYGQFHENQT